MTGQRSRRPAGKRDHERQHFARLDRYMMETPAWRALSPMGQALFPWLLLEWRGPDANNNGKISLSVRQAAERLGVGTDAAARAFHQLQAKGFLVVTEAARLGVTGQAKGPSYEITTIQLPHSDKREGRRLYKDWQPGADFPIHKARANNPTGRNRKTESHPENRDRNVIKIGTKRESAS